MWPPVPPPDTSTRILYRCYLFCVYLFRYILMSPAATSEKEEGLAGAPRAPAGDCVPLHPLRFCPRRPEGLAGTPRAPAGGLRPPAPPMFLPAQARGFSGDTPRPGRRLRPPAPPTFLPC